MQLSPDYAKANIAVCGLEKKVQSISLFLFDFTVHMCSIPVYVTTREALQSPWILFANFNNVSTDRVNTVLFIRLRNGDQTFSSWWKSVALFPEIRIVKYVILRKPILKYPTPPPPPSGIVFYVSYIYSRTNGQTLKRRFQPYEILKIGKIQATKGLLHDMLMHRRTCYINVIQCST